MAGEEDGSMDELRSEIDEYPLPESSAQEDKKESSYKNVDVTIRFKKEQVKDTKGHVLFSDVGEDVRSSSYDEKRGVLRVPIVLAKEMVYDYSDYSAYRPKEELEAVAKYVVGVPVTRDHPVERMVTDRAEVLGTAVEAEYADDELRAILEITDKVLIEDIQSGKLKGVSPGHFSRLDRSASGAFNGVPYDLTQRDVYIDHIAIVREGRCNVSDGCGILLDTKEEADKEGNKKKKEGDEREKMVSEEVLTKLDLVLGAADKLKDEALKADLVGLKEALEMDQSSKKEPETDAKVDAEKAKVLDEAVKKVTKERDELRTQLDEIVSAEKVKLVDELGSLQDVKAEEQLKEMSLDALKADIELVKALRGDDKFTLDIDARGDADAAIKSKYKEVGRGGNG